MFDKKVLLAYFRQQRDLSMPDMIFSSRTDIDTLLGDSNELPFARFSSAQKTANATGAAVAEKSSAALQKKPAVPSASDKQSVASQLAGLKTVDQLEPSMRPRPVRPQTVPVVNVAAASVVSSANSTMSFDQKRAALRTLYFEGCTRCQLARTRKTFVFGEGRADGPVMVIGEAPGADEDDQGLPFVGAAGQLLNNMLKAINLDRTKNVFITNVLKCRPPENRNPESTEIITCTPILARQIEIIKPKAILILGRIAAQTLLGNADSIAKLRSKTHLYNNIPSMVIYHPAALLRNAEYKRPAWEDLKQFQKLLTDLGVYESAKL